jgi:hypothetical protein
MMDEAKGEIIESAAEGGNPQPQVIIFQTKSVHPQRKLPSEQYAGVNEWIHLPQKSWVNPPAWKSRRPLTHHITKIPAESAYHRWPIRL